MKAATVAAVVTATIASNISDAQTMSASNIPATLPGILQHVQPEEAPQLQPALKSDQSPTQQVGLPFAQPASPESGDEVKPMISRPKTPIEFVKNFKAIFDDNLLMQDAFYTDTKLKDIFSLENVLVIESSGDPEKQFSIFGDVSDFIFPRIKISEFFGGTVRGAGFVGGKTTRQSGVVTAALNFGMYKGGPDFDAATKIFQKKFVRVPPQPSPHGGPGAATAPHGNETWKFEQVDDQTERAITISFNPAGSLSDVLIEIKKIWE